MVTLKVGDQNSDFMVDTGAELSVVTKPVAPLSEKTTAVTGVSGEEMIKSVSDQIRSVSQSCPTLCDPMNRSTPGLPGVNSRSSLRLTSIESAMPSSHLILCRPLLLLPAQKMSYGGCGRGTK